MKAQTLTRVGMVIVCAAALNGLTNAAIVDVAQIGLTFDPQSVTVEPGDTVRWTWGGGNHTVTSGAPCNADGVFDAPLNSASQTFEWVVPGDASGTIEYFCRPHCVSFDMVGEIVVESGPERCPEDLVDPVGVEQQDLNAVLNRWGDPTCDPGGVNFPCPEDLAAPAGVEQQDLNAVLNAWGDPLCE